MIESNKLMFFARGPFCWGTGKTEAKAIANASKNWSRQYSGIARPKHEHFSLVVFEGPGEFEFTIGEMGEIRNVPEGVTFNKYQTSSLAMERVA